MSVPFFKDIGKTVSGVLSELFLHGRGETEFFLLLLISDFLETLQKCCDSVDRRLYSFTKLFIR